MKFKNFRGMALLFALLSLTTLACGLFDDGAEDIPRNAAVVNVVANTSLKAWLETAVPNFNASETENAAGDPVYVVVEYTESGQAVTQMAGGTDVALWLPEEQVWVNLLADQGNGSFQNDCVSVVESPLVIGMWRSVAEALGWPGLPLGWLDIGSLAADPSAWNYYSGGELGDTFRLGHTHPGLSGSGASTLLALVQSAQSKTDAVTIEDIQQPIVQASVGAFEGGVTWFSASTDALADTMQQRGVNYLTAAVMYENTAVYYGNGDIVPIYPLEGTFMATHPACLNAAADSTAQEGAQMFRDYLLDVEGQETAVSVGLRPVNSAVSVGAPLDEAHGVDLAQPAIVFNSPSVAAIYGVQDVWAAARKDVNLVMLLDTSGSMRGSKMDNMRTAAEQFVEQMGDDDYITLIAFATEPILLVQHVQVGPNRQKIIGTIARLEASGDTTLFDAIGDGAAMIAETTQSDTTNALVVLTDGQDTRSYRYSFNDALVQAAAANNTTVFTIAYGTDADEDVLSALAASANGNFYLGDEASIAAIYEEMSAAFGGNVGVGR
ncbi:MAG: VWA domain-containing protein [Ardenticatenaceae bacterium]|nr:VWA domain-containing protein [Anaerolineales bacterium]MCB8921700.1 VWA domain-containing protein [Ardenticatenaceae bacterium]MCB8990781.1 VWA domain-containing protein [Ardenticatenaceae bacterium]MCB9003268.1 VWA domain-containing protein [Ardenticatenaceae bacterium]